MLFLALSKLFWFYDGNYDDKIVEDLAQSWAHEDTVMFVDRLIFLLLICAFELSTVYATLIWSLWN